MTHKKLAQGVKELRKRKGLSQEGLSKNSGLSLRTIQRVENGETKPTAETLRRICNVLDVTPEELNDWETKNESLRNTIKTKNEYLHILDSKLIISSTSKISNLVEDYGRSVNNVFKSLMVFIIFIIIFTILALFFYNIEKVELSIYAGAFAFFFLTLAFYSMLFTSGTSLIEIDNIYKIQVIGSRFQNAVVIYHKESGRLKKRSLIIEENQVDTVKNILLTEKLIEKKDIKLKTNNLYYLLVVIIIISITPSLMNSILDINQMMTSGFILILLSLIMTTKILIGLIKSLSHKTTNH